MFNINFWITPHALANWSACKEKKNGRPFIYGDELIKAMCFIRFKFHLSLRETEGFFRCYTQICRRMKTITLPPEMLQKKSVTDIVIDLF